MVTRIYGASDDLIEIDGQIYDEIDAYSPRPKEFEIKTSNGTLATIMYNGKWVITPIENGTDFIKIVKSVGDDSRHTEEHTDDVPSYSDVLLLSGEVKWIKINGHKCKP